MKTWMIYIIVMIATGTTGCRPHTMPRDLIAFLLVKAACQALMPFSATLKSQPATSFDIVCAALAFLSSGHQKIV
jgi:hypothetical protein